MKITTMYLVLSAALLAAPSITRAQDKSADKPAARPSKEELQEKLKNLPPEERAAKIKEFREKYGQRPGGPGGPEADKRREEFFRTLGVDPEELKKLPPQERVAKLREAAEKKHAELKKKKEDGTITEQEKEMLQKMEERQRMMQERRSEGDRPHKPEGDHKKDEKPADKK